MSSVQSGISAISIRGARWQKSSRSNSTGNCLELAKLPSGEFALRNSRDPNGPALIYTRAEIEAFVLGVKDGDFDNLIS
jgi:hypothetical protein